MIKFLSPFVATLLLSSSLWAQNFVADPAFGEQGVARFSYASGNDRFRRLERLSNGSFVSAGHALRATQDFCVARFNSKGQLDANFAANGLTFVDVAKGTESLNGFAIQSDGKILAAGSTRLNNVTSIALCRLLSNGSPDPGFGTNGVLKFSEPQTASFSLASSIASLSDNKILIGGYYLQAGVYRGFVKKLLENGQPDQSFGINGTLTINFNTANSSNYVDRVVVSPSGKIYVYGQNYVNRFQLGLARITSAGALDNTFSGDGVLVYSFSASGQNYSADLHIGTNDEVVVSGYANSSSANYRGFLAKFSGNGDLNPDFGTSGQIQIASGTGFNALYASQKTADGGFVATGETFSQNRYRGILFKVTAQGSLETGFGNNGLTFFSSTPADAFGNGLVTSDNSIWAVGAQYNSSDNSYESLLFGVSGTGQAL